jgi:hypothetical protein
MVLCCFVCLFFFCLFVCLFVVLFCFFCFVFLSRSPLTLSRVLSLSYTSLLQEDALPDHFSSWLEFLLACKLPPEVAIEYDQKFTAEDILVSAQLHELKDRAILKGENR